MKHIYFFLLLSFLFYNSKSQNLIANSSFENTINNYDCSGSYANYQISAPVFGYISPNLLAGVPYPYWYGEGEKQLVLK